jgi:Mn-dependent DtxR family transcriptional regulator
MLQTRVKDQIMYKSYTSFNQLREYLRALQKNGLMDYEVGKHCCRMTEKGRRLLQLRNKMEQIAYYLSNKIYLHYKLLFSLIDKATHNHNHSNEYIIV